MSYYGRTKTFPTIQRTYCSRTQQRAVKYWIPKHDWSAIVFLWVVKLYLISFCFLHVCFSKLCHVPVITYLTFAEVCVIPNLPRLVSPVSGIFPRNFRSCTHNIDKSNNKTSVGIYRYPKLSIVPRLTDIRIEPNCGQLLSTHSSMIPPFATQNGRNAVQDVCQCLSCRH